MLRTPRRRLGAGGLVVLCAALVAALCTAFLVSGSAQAKGHRTKLSARQQLNIATSPHRHLMQVCDRGLSVDARGIKTRAKGTSHRRLIIDQTTCYTATAGTPTDTAVFGASGDELYMLDSGKIRHRGKRWLAPVSVHRVRAGVVAVVYAGYLSKDPMCCPSRLYERVFTLHAKGATHGRLHRVPLH